MWASGFQRDILDQFLRRLQEPRRFLQVLAGPRQVGKTTLARQGMALFGERCTYATADNPAPGDAIWIDQQWELARLQCGQGGCWLLVIDEIQKVPRWSEAVKRLWTKIRPQVWTFGWCCLVRLRF